MTELSWRKNLAGPSLDLSKSNIESGGNNSTLVESTNQLNYNLSWSMIIDDLELSNISFLLHEFKELD